MKSHSPWGTSKNPVKFRIPTADNLVPIRLDIEIDGQRFRDAFIWNPSDPDSEVVVFARRTVKDLKLPPAFVTQIAQSIQTQLAEFRSYEGQDMYNGEKVVPIKLDLRVNHTLIKDHFLWDLNNFESDPEEFAKTFCKDMGIVDPEVGDLGENSSYHLYSHRFVAHLDIHIFAFVVDMPAIAIAIREQLYEIAVQNVTSVRESRINKKGRKGFDYAQASKANGNAVDLFKLFGNKSSVLRKRKEWDAYEPIVDLLSNEEVDALEAKQERSNR